MKKFSDYMIVDLDSIGSNKEKEIKKQNNETINKNILLNERICINKEIEKIEINQNSENIDKDEETLKENETGYLKLDSKV